MDQETTNEEVPLTPEEWQIVWQALNSVPVQGVQAMQKVIVLMEKVSKRLQE